MQKACAFASFYLCGPILQIEVKRDFLFPPDKNRAKKADCIIKKATHIFSGLAIIKLYSLHESFWTTAFANMKEALLFARPLSLKLNAFNISFAMKLSSIQESRWVVINGITAIEGSISPVKRKKGALWQQVKKHKFMYFLAAPAFVYFVVFKYLPMWGILIAFQKYSPWTGFWQSEWVGLYNFINFFRYDDFWILLRNTLGINLLNLALYFPAPIIVALLLNEIHREGFKRVVQTLIYLPHFLSWVIVVSFTYFFLSVDVGIVNKALTALGYEPFPFMTNSGIFWLLLVGQSIWKEVGWGTIIYLAAISGVDTQLYEAAIVDGASRLRQLWHITLPGIKGTIVIMLILRLGNIMEVGFEHILLMQNPLVMPVADVFDTYVYQLGIIQGQFSFSTAVGLFKSVVSIILVVGANRIAKIFGEDGLY